MALNYSECLKINKAAEKIKFPSLWHTIEELFLFSAGKDLIDNLAIGKVRFIIYNYSSLHYDE